MPRVIKRQACLVRKLTTSAATPQVEVVGEDSHLFPSLNCLPAACKKPLKP